ncbi:MAG: zinc-binding dehydrogenase [Pseudomonadota bacterium]
MKQTYRCVVLDPKTKSLAVVEKEIPKLKSHEVLVRVWGSPINPSDRLFSQGLYGIPVSTPITPGFEGTGSVVDCGKSFWAKRLMGKNISGAVQGGDGFWAEYVVLPAQQSLVLDPLILQETAACAFVNPLTALALMEPIQRGIFPSFLQTAAASQLGRMIQRMSQKAGVPCVHVVHRASLKQELESQGWQNVIDSSQSGFENELRDLTHQLNIRYAIDAVAGAMTGNLVRNLPEQSQVVVYGVLSGETCLVDPGDLIFKNQQIKGFWLSHWIKNKKFVELPFLFRRLKKFLKTEGQTQVARRLSLEEAIEEIKNPKGNASAGKILVMPGLG